MSERLELRITRLGRGPKRKAKNEKRQAKNDESNTRGGSLTCGHGRLTMRRDDPSASRTCSCTVSSGRQDDGSFRRVSGADRMRRAASTQVSITSAPTTSAPARAGRCPNAQGAV